MAPAKAVQLERGELRGQPWAPRAPHLSVERGLALVPEERRKEGIFIDEPISMNLAVSADNSFSRWSLFGHRQAWRWAEEVIARVGVRALGPATAAGDACPAATSKRWPSASGCAVTPSVLIFDEPTKGVDVKAKQPICSA